MSSNAGDVAGDITGLGDQIGNQVQRVVTTWTAQLENAVKRNASGRPGPNAPYGNYRRSITRSLTRSGTETVGTVGTAAPQGARLELGFHGTDSLGRRYNQPPYPHFGPALDQISDGFERAIRDAGYPGGGAS